VTRLTSVLFCLALQAFFTLAFPSEALAGPLATTLSNVQRAERYWGEPCPGAHVEWTRLPSNHVGEAELDGCDDGRTAIRLDESRETWRMDTHWWCTVVVHEYGHLIGLGHSKDPRSPMHDPPTHIVKGC
jgi:hypothetical protein